MIAFFVALAMVTMSVVGFFAFAGWVSREHLHAKRYRLAERARHLRLERLENERSVPVAAPVVINATAPSTPSWDLTYRVDGKLQTEVITGPTEGEAVRAWFLRTRINYGNIVSCKAR